jgi:hypothetical protein
MLRTSRSGASDVTDRSSASIAIAAGGSTTDRTSNRATSSANARVSKRSSSTMGAPARRAKHTL